MIYSLTSLSATPLTDDIPPAYHCFYTLITFSVNYFLVTLVNIEMAGIVPPSESSVVRSYGCSSKVQYLIRWLSNSAFSLYEYRHKMIN